MRRMKSINKYPTFPLTINEVAAEFRVPPARVERVVRRCKIEPSVRLGRVRGYGDDEFARIGCGLAAGL